MHRWLRILVCMLVICALLINISPIKAHASAAATVGWVLAEAWPIIKAVLMGLGVLELTDQVLARVFTDYQSRGLIDENGYMEVYSFGDGFYGLAEPVIQFLFNDLYDRGVVVDPAVFYGDLSANEKFSYYGSSAQYYTTKAVEFTRIYFEYTNRSNERAFAYGYLLFSPESFRTINPVGNVNAGSAYSEGLHLYYYFASNVVSFPLGSSEIGNLRSGLQGYKDVSAFHNASTGGFELENALYFLFTASPDIYPGVGFEDVELGYVAPAGTEVYEEYTEWFENSVEIDSGDDDILVVPFGSTVVGAPPTEYDQEDVWTGTLPIVTPIIKEDDDVIAPPGIVPGPTEFSIDEFTIPLANYFPFCIPFDIYAFLSCLDADPVAPVIEWSVFELDGTSHPITIDLSAYDSVALLLRRLQLLLFCIGLAAKTRSLIRG